MNCILCQSPDVPSFFKGHVQPLGKREYFKCDQCALIFVDPKYRLTPQEEKARYDSHKNSPYDLRYIDFLNRLCEPLSLRLPEGACGLDFGCGPGPTIKVIYGKKGFQLENYDPYYFPNEELLTRKYDYITCTETVEHMFDPRKEFDLFDKMLKEGGVIGLMTNIYEGEKDFEKWWYVKDPTHVCFYHQKTIEWIGTWKNWQVEFLRENAIILADR